jgi:glc operon protein GlcG
MRRLVLRIIFAACLIAPLVQTASAQPAAPAIPEAMPFDIPYGAPINSDDAHKALIAAVNEAKKHNWKMSISVVDPGGNLLAHVTMDGTQFGSIAISQAKARTAALFRRPSKVFADGINGANGPGTPATLSLLALSQGAASEGGFPIVRDGKLVGAIGASGGIASQDGVTAKAGLAALGISTN